MYLRIYQSIRKVSSLDGWSPQEVYLATARLIRFFTSDAASLKLVVVEAFL